MRFMLIFVYSYLLGSIPFGYLLVRIFCGQDVRASGSGNIGATNVSRTSPALGVLTLVLDALKGLVAVAITRALYPHNGVLLGLAAFASIAGHIFPVWLKFKGGKGVATGLGAFVLIVPKTILLMIVIFVAVALAGRYVSLASVITAALFPLLAWMNSPYAGTPPMLAFMAASSILIIARHHENVGRILAGTEPPISFSRRHN